MKKIISFVFAVVLGFGVVAYSGGGVAHPCMRDNHTPCAVLKTPPTHWQNVCKVYDKAHHVYYTIPCDQVR